MSKKSSAANIYVAAQDGVTTFSQSDGLVRLLAQQGAAIMFSSYQSGLLYMLGHTPNGGAHLHQSVMAKPMGIWVENDDAFTLSAGYQIMRFKNGIEPGQLVNQQFDACYVPRDTHFTGELDAHEIGIDRNGQPIFVNTRFNCLATTDPRYSFRELWRPPFISALVDEDRCHLNGLAMDNGEPAYVTAVSRSDTIDGWRDRRDNGGVVIDVRSNKVVCEGLSMPHSPRLHNGELWVLNSGTGELGGRATEGTGLGRMRVEYVGAELPDRLDQLPECGGIVRRTHRSAQPGYPSGRDVRSLRHEIVLLVGIAPASEETLIESVTVEMTHQAADLHGRPTNVHARNDAQHPDGSHAVHHSTIRKPGLT